MSKQKTISTINTEEDDSVSSLYSPSYAGQILRWVFFLFVGLILGIGLYTVGRLLLRNKESENAVDNDLITPDIKQLSVKSSNFKMEHLHTFHNSNFVKLNTLVNSDRKKSIIDRLSHSNKYLQSEDDIDYKKIGEEYSITCVSTPDAHRCPKNSQSWSKIALLKGGGYTVIWKNQETIEPVTNSIYAQQYSTNGTVVRSGHQVNFYGNDVLGGILQRFTMAVMLSVGKVWLMRKMAFILNNMMLVG